MKIIAYLWNWPNGTSWDGHLSSQDHKSGVISDVANWWQVFIHLLLTTEKCLLTHTRSQTKQASLGLGHHCMWVSSSRTSEATFLLTNESGGDTSSSSPSTLAKSKKHQFKLVCRSVRIVVCLAVWRVHGNQHWELCEALFSQLSGKQGQLGFEYSSFMNTFFPFNFTLRLFRWHIKSTSNEKPNHTPNQGLSTLQTHQLYQQSPETPISLLLTPHSASKHGTAHLYVLSHFHPVAQ